jgi:predicted ester cyclase
VKPFNHTWHSSTPKIELWVLPLIVKKGRRIEMTVESNKVIIRRLVDEVFNGGKLDVLDQLVTPNWRFHGPMGMEYQGVEGFKKMMTEMFAMISGIHVRLLDVVAEDDKVFHRWLLEGTGKGTYQGILIEGRPISATYFLFSLFSNGKEAEVWECTDTLVMMQKMGLMPNMAPMGK